MNNNCFNGTNCTVNIESAYNENNKIELIGYITLSSKKTNSNEKEIITLNDIEFNPLNILGDLKYICTNLQLKDKAKPIVGLDKNLLFHTPYKLESCLKLDVSHDVRYFFLLEKIREIITSDKQVSSIDLHRIAQYFQLSPIHEFSTKAEYDKQNNLFIYSPQTYHFCDMTELSNPLPDEHIYQSHCKNASEIIFAIFYYLMTNQYHFYKCQHCQKYSAISRKQGRKKYCQRKNFFDDLSFFLDEDTERRYHLNKYKNLSCEKAIDKLLNRIRQRKKKIYDHLNKYKFPEQLDDFLNGYNDINDNIKENPSTENLLSMIKYLEENSIKYFKKKKGK